MSESKDSMSDDLKRIARAINAHVCTLEDGITAALLSGVVRELELIAERCDEEAG